MSPRSLLDVTLCTLMTADRVPSLHRLARSWGHLISAAYLADDFELDARRAHPAQQAHGGLGLASLVARGQRGVVHARVRRHLLHGLEEPERLLPLPRTAARVDRRAQHERVRLRPLAAVAHPAEQREGRLPPPAARARVDRGAVGDLRGRGGAGVGEREAPGAAVECGDGVRRRERTTSGSDSVSKVSRAAAQLPPWTHARMATLYARVLGSSSHARMPSSSRSAACGVRRCAGVGGAAGAASVRRVCGGWRGTCHREHDSIAARKSAGDASTPALRSAGKLRSSAASATW